MAACARGCVCVCVCVDLARLVDSDQQPALHHLAADVAPLDGVVEVERDARTPTLSRSRVRLSGRVSAVSAEHWGGALHPRGESNYTAALKSLGSREATPTL